MTLLEQAYRKDKLSLRRSIYRHGGVSWSDTEDILHDAVLAAMTVQDVKYPTPLIYTIAINLCRIKHRQTKNRIGLDTVALVDPSTDVPTVEDTAIKNQTRQLYNGAVSNLCAAKPRHAEAFTLRAYRELPFESIGTHLNVTPRRAQQYIAEAVTFCRKYVELHGA